MPWKVQLAIFKTRFKTRNLETEFQGKIFTMCYTQQLEDKISRIYNTCFSYALKKLLYERDITFLKQYVFPNKLMNSRTFFVASAH